MADYGRIAARVGDSSKCIVRCQLGRYANVWRALGRRGLESGQSPALWDHSVDANCPRRDVDFEAVEVET